MKRLISLVFVLLLLLSNASPVLAAASTENTEPAESTELVETEAPTEPVGTTEPIETEAPTEPVGTTEPIETEAPTEPFSSEVTTEPETPMEPRPDEYHRAFISGMPDGGFYPNAPTTRAELAVIIFALGSCEAGSARFPDVSEGAWYAEAVNALAQAGILGGFPDGGFHPNECATRAQLAAILASVSGAPRPDTGSFPDVPADHWAHGAIALARELGWVSGFPDGSFRPDQNVTRAEAVVMINKFAGRVPDLEAIDRGEGLRFFPDVEKGSWYYYGVMEASAIHTAHFEPEDDAEHWIDPQPGANPYIPNGFYCFGKKLFAVEDGAYVRTAGTRSLNGITYSCEGSSGVCTARTEVLTLAGGDLLLLSGGNPVAAPGTYRDGLYLKAGHLYAAQDGHILHSACTGSFNGISYTCSGPNGRCTVADWNKLSLPGVDLSVFSQTLTPEASDSGSAGVSTGALLRAAVRVYETYFRVEYPLNSAQIQDYVSKALEYGILDRALSSYDQAATRRDAAVYLCRALRCRELTARNDISALPDVPSSDPAFSALLALYRAGIMTGFGEEHDACADGAITVSELAELLRRLERPGERVSFTLPAKIVRTLQYGTSGSGRYPLTAYQLGNGKNVLILSFAIHGWEDAWDRDGEALVYLADQTRNWLEANYELVRNGDWTVYILRCMNPDGLNLGTTCNGPGRCTTTSFNADGVLIDRGVDMNRCFPYSFQCYTSGRNYNGSAPLACVEARAAADFITRVKGSGYNILIDTHGWFSQILTSSGTGIIYNTLHAYFPHSSYKTLSGGHGYLSSWAGYVHGFDSCLFELPQSITSYSEFLSYGVVSKFESVIQYLLRNYNGPGAVIRETESRGETRRTAD